MTSLSFLPALESAAARAGWQAAVLALLVVIACRVLGDRLEARWRFGLWLLVLARLALPVTIAAPWSLFGLIPRPAEPPAAAVPLATPAVPEAFPPSAEPVVPERGEVALEVPDTVAPTEPSTALEPGTALAAVWLGGVLLLLGRHARQQARLWRRQRVWRTPSDPELPALFQRCRGETGVTRRVRLLVAEDGSGPATLGVARPAVVIPHGLLTRLTVEELRLVLLHELAHVRRRDALLDRVAALVVALHWFNPIAWLALAGLRRERELACDQAVLRRLAAAESRCYGHTLLKVAEQWSVPALVPGASGMFGTERSLTRRIRMIADYRRPSPAGMAAGGVLFVLLGVVGLTDARGRPEAPADTALPDAAGMDEPAGPWKVAGVCVDEQGQPVAGARAALYRHHYGLEKVDLVRAATTAADGRFTVRDVEPPPAAGESATWGYVLAITRKGNGSLLRPIPMGVSNDQLRFNLRPPGTLQGRVTDSAGKPVAGARVWAGYSEVSALTGICATSTDADGRYAITDLPVTRKQDFNPVPAGTGAWETRSGCYFDVRHADFARALPTYHDIPATVDVVLQPAGAVEGRVVDQVTGRPAAGATVYVQGTLQGGPAGGGARVARADADGKYRLTSLQAGTYNLWADAPERTCVALDSLAVTAGQTRKAPDLALIEGSWIDGRLVDAVTREPIGGANDRRLRVAAYGAARPRSGAACQSCAVDDRGYFRLRVAPGVVYPYIMYPDLWERTQRREYFQKGIDVKPGEVASLEFRILPAKPLPEGDPAPVRLPLPVPAERQAAAVVRQYGGWYKVDADNHVVEVNMVYHEADGHRHDNSLTADDTALRAVGAFPRLKRLYLHGGQATDAGLESLAGLKELEALRVWDARLTDAGIRHLAGLASLKEVHIQNGLLSNDALAVFAQLPKVTSLSLQGNAFSNAGFEHLSGMRQLRNLWVGMNRLPITAVGVRHLTGLAGLQRLDLQRAPIGDAGIAALQGMPDLRLLYVSGSTGVPLTDASVERLSGMTKLTQLMLTNTHLSDAAVGRLAALPALEHLIVESAAITGGLQGKLHKQRPGLGLNLTNPSAAP